MRLGLKFAMLLSCCVLSSLLLVTYVQAHFFAVDQEAYLSDLQSTIAISIEKRLDLSLTLLYTQLQEVVETPDLDLKSVLIRMPGVSAGELWKDEKPWKAYPEFSREDFPKPHPGSWTLWKGHSSNPHPALRWIAAYDRVTAILAIDPQWLASALESNHGAITELVSADGAILLRSGRNGLETTEAGNFDGTSTLTKALAGQPGVINTTRFTTEKNDVFLGTFLPLSTDPPLAIVVRTPWSVIDAVLRRTYRQSAWIGVFFLLLTLIIGTAYSRTLTSPLSSLVHQTVEVGQGHFNLPALDVTDRRDEVGILARAFNRMGQELQKIQSTLRRTERVAALGEFSASIAHEIRNPLTSIILNSQVAGQLLKDGDKPNAETLREVLGLVCEEALRANRIIDRLMKFARQESTPTQIIDLRSRAMHSLSLLSPIAEQAGVKLVWEICDEPVWATADGDQIHEVLANLVQNAFHAVEGSVERRVTVCLSKAFAFAELTVTDTGRGIAPEARDHLFEPFFTTKPIGKGTGLGLAVCHGIIQSHKGKIEVESPADGGVGTRFRILIPIGETPAAAAA